MIPKKLKLTQHDFWSNQSKAYKGADYKSMKDRVKDRDGATCRQCGKPLPNKRRALCYRTLLPPCLMSGAGAGPGATTYANLLSCVMFSTSPPAPPDDRPSFNFLILYFWRNALTAGWFSLRHLRPCAVSRHFWHTAWGLSSVCGKTRHRRHKSIL